MEYFVGMVLFAGVWGAFVLYRKDLFSPMVYSGGFFALILTAGFFGIKLLWPDIPTERTIVPGYWNPDTLFDLGRRTGGYALEDMLYGFFTAGVAVAVYETLFRHRISRKHTRHHIHAAILVGALGACIAVLFPINLMWALIAFCAVGAATLWYQRPDLVRHSLLGGISYLIVYSGFFLLFMAIFPHYIPEVYSFENFIGITPLGIPLEEYLFAFSFGLMWSPIYEYMHDLKAN
jgi:hypothetical protein